MTGTPRAAGFDLADPAIQADPYPAYARLRAEAPVHGLPGSGTWVVSRHAEIERVLRDPATFSSEFAMDVPIMSIVMRDPPDHTRLRGTVNKAFTPRNIQHLTGLITETAHALLDAAGPRVDFVRAYANPLSVTVICAMLGVPLDRRDAMNRYARDALLASFAATGMGSPALLAEAEGGLRALMGILEDAVRAHRAAPRDNIISALVVEEAEGTLSRDELLNLCGLLLIGGHETTANLIASGAHVLAGDPALWRRLKAEPASIARFVEELARLRPPLQRIARRTTRAVELGGVALPADAMLMLFPGSANRDAARWADADRLDLSRDGRGHLGFGTGIHVCPGASLARMEARIAFEVLVERCSGLRLDPDARPVPVAGYAAGNLGWNILPLILTPAGTGGPIEAEKNGMSAETTSLERIRRIVARSLELEVAEIDAGTCAANTPEWDSLAHMVILDAVSRAFDVRLPRHDAYTVKDVGALAALVDREAARAGSG